MLVQNSFSVCWCLRAGSLPGCNPSFALCCERCWLASVAQHPVPIQVVGCCPRSRTMIHVGAMPRSLELDHACSGTWFARPCLCPSTSPVGKADDLWCNTRRWLGRTRRSMLRRRWRCSFLHAVQTTFTAPIWPQLFGSLRSPVSWLVAGSTPAPGGPESCWLVLCSQHSARLGLQPGKELARRHEFGCRTYFGIRTVCVDPHTAHPCSAARGQ